MSMTCSYGFGTKRRKSKVSQLQACNDVWYHVSGFLDAEGVHRLVQTNGRLRNLLQRVYTDPPIPFEARLFCYLSFDTCVRPWRFGNGWGIYAWLRRPTTLWLALVERETKCNAASRKNYLCSMHIRHDDVEFLLCMTVTSSNGIISSSNRSVFGRIHTEWSHGFCHVSGYDKYLVTAQRFSRGLYELNRKEARRVAAKKITLSGWCDSTRHLLLRFADRGLLTQEAGTCDIGEPCGIYRQLHGICDATCAITRTFAFDGYPAKKDENKFILE